MQFELVAPWTEWNIETDIGDLAFYAKIDTGAFTTLIGLNIALKIGLTADFIKKQKCVRFIGAVEGSKGYAFKVPCSSLPLGNSTIPTKEICVPFAFVDNKRYRFVSEDRFLIGTNILNDYNMNVIFNSDSSGSSIKTAYLVLAPHKYIVPQNRRQEYTLSQLAKTIDNVHEDMEDGLTETISDD
jgi:hypothetical protein